MDEISSINESDAKPMSMDMLKDIHDRSHYHPSINGRYERYNIHDHIKQIPPEWKGALLSMRKMGKGLQKLFKAVVNELSE